MDHQEQAKVNIYKFPIYFQGGGIIFKQKKAMLAKATSGESNSNFLYTTASEFVEMYVGVGAKRVRELFNKARQLSPCIIFIDEIDSMGTKIYFSTQKKVQNVINSPMKWQVTPKEIQHSINYSQKWMDLEPLKM